MPISKPVKLRIQGVEGSFEVEPDETLAEALERYDQPLWLACRNGVCEICETALLSGTVSQRFPRGEYRGAADGSVVIRLCVSHALTDVVIAPPRERRKRPVQG